MIQDPTLGDWLDTELSAVEQGLAVRLRSAMPPGWREVPMRDAPALLTAAAATELALLLERGCETRWAAPGLLAVDALVTYACELAASGGADVPAECDRIFGMITAVLPQPDEAA